MDSIVIDEPKGGKYQLNTQFGDLQHSSIIENENSNNEWFPTILRDQNWKDNEISTERLPLFKPSKNNFNPEEPFLSGNGSQGLTVNKNSHRNKDAAWRKYDMKLGKGNLGLMKVEDGTLGDTFGGRHNNKNNKIINGLFANGKATRENLDGLLGQVSPIKQKQIVTSSSSQDASENEKSVQNIVNAFESQIKESISSSKDSSSNPVKSAIPISNNGYSNDISLSSLENSDDLVGDLLLESDQIMANMKSVPNLPDYTSDAEEFTTSVPIDSANDFINDLSLGVESMAVNEKELESRFENIYSLVKSDIDDKDLLRMPKLVPLLQNYSLREANASSLIPETPNPNLPPGITPTPFPGHKGLNFIPASEFKGKMWDKKLGKFVSVSSHVENNEIGEETKVVLQGLEEDGNSILKNTKGDAAKNQEVSFNLPDEFTSLEYSDENETQDDKFNQTSFGLGYGSVLVANDSSDAHADTDVDAHAIPVDQFTLSESHKLLATAILNTHPLASIPNWHILKELNISNQSLTNLHALKRLTPNLWYLDASNNNLTQLHGIPMNLQVLLVSYNKLSNMTNIERDSLQVLDVSNNGLKSWSIVSHLKNLVSLDASNNEIESVEDGLRMLRNLDLSYNKIGMGNGNKGHIDMSQWEMLWLEELRLDGNPISKVTLGDENEGLLFLSLQNCQLEKINVNCSDTVDLSLRKLNISDNFIKFVNLKIFGKLQSLIYDHCQGDLSLGNSIESVSLRFCQSEDAVLTVLSHPNVRKVKLIGSKISWPEYSKSSVSMITHLDASFTSLLTLPHNFSLMFPILLDLTLCFNNLQNLNGLQGLAYLQQLKLVGNAIKNEIDLYKFTKKCRKSLKLIDLRDNPLTHFYPRIWHGKVDGDAGVVSVMTEFERLYENDFTTRWENVGDAAYRERMLGWFNLKWLDGGRVNQSEINSAKENWLRIFSV